MVHCFSFDYGDKIAYFVWDVESGSLHAVDYNAYLCVKKNFKLKLTDEESVNFLRIPKTEIEEINEELNEMIKLGVLDAKPVLTYYSKKAGHIKAMCLHICHDCNLRCEYCFAHDGTYNTSHEYMSKEVGFASIDLLIRESGTVKNLEVDFFGGEPLLNFDVVKQIVEYAKNVGAKANKKFSFTMTTNCLLLDDDKINWLNEEMDNIVLSVDGRKEVHDRVRKTISGKSAYDVILSNALKVAKIRGSKRYYLRGTYTAYNLDFCKDVIAMVDEGFDQISVEPVVLEDSSPMAIKKVDLSKLYREYDKLAVEMYKREKEGKFFNFFHFMIDLNNGPCIHKRLHGCGAGLDYVAVAPWGDVFPCHQFVDKPEFTLGSVYEGIKRQDIREQFAKNSLLTKPSCVDCPAKYYCGGGCSANAYNFGESINGRYEIGCELTKKRLECSLALEASRR